jgi:hypothetical protein
MRADKPNFTDSELYFMETIIQEDYKKFKILLSDTKTEHRFSDEMLLEYESILEKLRKFRTEEHNWYKAIDSLVKRA